MPSTTEVLARLAQWARQIKAHARRADDLTHREFTADLAALVESTAAKDGALVASQFESGPGAELYRPHEFSSCYSRAATLGSSPIWDPPVLGARFHSAV